MADRDLAVGKDYHKSSYSGAGNCVEVRMSQASEVMVRHSRRPTAGYLTFTSAEWQAFLLGVKNGEFDIG